MDARATRKIADVENVDRKSMFMVELKTERE